MSTSETSLKIEKACREAHEKFLKLDADRFHDIISKLEFVIVSYNADKNPVGLYEIGEAALSILKEYKEEKPRLVPKKLIEDLEKAVTSKN